MKTLRTKSSKDKPNEDILNEQERGDFFPLKVFTSVYLLGQSKERIAAYQGGESVLNLHAPHILPTSFDTRGPANGFQIPGSSNYFDQKMASVVMGVPFIQQILNIYQIIL